MPSFQSSRKPRGTVGRLLALTAGFLFFSTAVTAGTAPGFIGSLDIGNTVDNLPENTLSEAYEGHTSRHGAHLSTSRVFRRVAAPFPQDDEECDEDGNCTKAAATCISYTDKACPSNSACCPKDKPNCVTVNGKAECQAAAAQKTTAAPTTTAKPSTTAAAPTTSKPATTSPPPVVNTKPNTSKAATTPPAPTTTPKGNTNTAKPTTTKNDEKTTTEALEETSETTEPPAVIQTGTSTETLSESATTTTEAAQWTSTETPIEDEKRKSTLAPIISGAIAGSICFFALSCVAVAAFRKKREERRMDRLSEEEAAAASRKEPMSSSAQPMGYGGQAELDELPKEYVIETSRGDVFGVRDQIPPPSPPPNAMVVGTPPYRRQYSNNSQPGTPTRLGSALPPQRGYNAGMGTPGFEYHHDIQQYDEDAQFYQAYPHNQSVSSNIGIGGGGDGYGHGRPEAY